MTDLRGPASPLLPLRPPEPAPGCAICSNLAKQRAAAKAEGDYSRVSDCNIRMRRHGCAAPISR